MRKACACPAIFYHDKNLHSAGISQPNKLSAPQCVPVYNFVRKQGTLQGNNRIYLIKSSFCNNSSHKLSCFPCSKLICLYPPWRSGANCRQALRRSRASPADYSLLTWPGVETLRKTENHFDITYLKHPDQCLSYRSIM